MKVWFARHSDQLIATDDDSRRVIHRLAEGECQCFERIAVRDPVMHRRYWALCSDLPKKVRRIEIDRVDGKPVYMPIRHRKDAHTAFKLCTGLYEVMPVEGTDYAIRVPDSTDFDSMTPDEWLPYWIAVLDVCVEKVAPEIEVPEARNDMLRYVERWVREAA